MNTSVSVPLRIGKNEREQIVSEYMKFLDRRDGETLPDGKTLSVREEDMNRLRAQKVRFDGEVDRDLFAAQYQRFSRDRETPPELMLLLAFVKINSHEAFAVDAISRNRKRIPECEKRLINEERYHTQLLLSASDLFNIPVEGAALPPRALKVLVTGISRTPAWIMHPITLAAEMLGVASFKRLLTATRRTLRHQPELRDAMEERVMEVCIDELGHLSYNRLFVGPAGMAVARALIPPILWGFRNSLPELDMLCGGPMTVEEVVDLSFDSLPEVARRQAFVV